MTVIFCIVAVIAAISIYDYFSTRSWQQVTSSERNDTVFEKRNRQYGAYRIRRDYNKIVLVILGGLTLGAGVLYAATRGKEATYIAKAPETGPVIVIPLDNDNEIKPEIFDTKPQPPESVEETSSFHDIVAVDDPVPDPVPVPDPGGNVSIDPNPGGGDPFGQPGDPQPPGNGGGGEPTQDPPTPPTMWVDEPAEFPGGHKAMLRFLAENLNYPQVARELNLEGKCNLKFVVSKTGNISDVTVERGVPDCPECDKEAVRVVKKMPDWRPGKVKGKAVDSYFNLPVKFTLQ